MTTTYPIGTGIIQANATIGGINDFAIYITGQKLSTGTAVEETLVPVNSSDDINALFGQGSHIAKELRAAFEILNISPNAKPTVYAIAKEDNNAGTAATGTFTFTGTATASGQLTFFIDSKTKGQYVVDIASGDTANAIALKLQSAVNLNNNKDYDVSVNTGVVTITYKHKGTIGNVTLLDFQGNVAGITVAKSGNYLSGGATDPVLTNLFASMVNQKAFLVQYPSTWAYSTLKTFLESRQNVVGKILDGKGVQCRIDTYANLVTSGTANPSDFYITRPFFTTTDLIENPDYFASQFAAMIALSATPNAFIDFAPETTSGDVRNLGKPYHNLQFKNLAPLPQTRAMTSSQIEVLEGYGYWTLQNNPINTYPQTRSVVTGYYKNPTTGNIDNTFAELPDVLIDSYARALYVLTIQQTYPRHSLTSGVSQSNISVNKADIKETMFQTLKTLQSNNINDNGTLQGTQKSIDDEWNEYFENTFVLDLARGSFSVKLPIRRVGQLKEFTITLIIKQ